MYHKTCTKCHMTKEISDYYYCNNGYQNHCKICRKQATKNYKKSMKDPETKQARQKRSAILNDRQNRNVKLCCVRDFYKNLENFTKANAA